MSKKSFTSHSRNPEDVTYDDAFFINKENESITWIYFNPDSFSGGQYVTNTLSFDEIRKAAQDHKSAGDFFDYLGSIANQTLADVGTEWFVEAENAFRQTPDLTNCSAETMDKLTALTKERIFSSAAEHEKRSKNIDNKIDDFLDKTKKFSKDNDVSKENISKNNGIEF